MIGHHIKYAKYVIRHKFFVGVECFKHGLFWRGLMHDLSKLLPSEWLPYARFFYLDKVPRRDATGYYKPTDTGDEEFDHAWLLHQKRNDHHWQWWILPEDDGGEKIIPMSDAAMLEMVCDWCGASLAQGHGGWAGVQYWYKKNRAKMRLAVETQIWVEEFLKAKQDK
jgi:hypothetical protein